MTDKNSVNERLEWYKAKLERVRQSVPSPSTLTAVEQEVAFYEGLVATLEDFAKSVDDLDHDLLYIMWERKALAMRMNKVRGLVSIMSSSPEHPVEAEWRAQLLETIDAPVEPNPYRNEESS